MFKNMKKKIAIALLAGLILCGFMSSCKMGCAAYGDTYKYQHQTKY